MLEHRASSPHKMSGYEGSRKPAYEFELNFENNGKLCEEGTFKTELI